MKSVKSVPSKGSMVEPDPLIALQAENSRLIALLEANGIEWRLPPEPPASASKPGKQTVLTVLSGGSTMNYQAGQVAVLPGDRTVLAEFKR